MHGDTAELNLGNGLCARRVGDGSKDQSSDGCRHLQPFLAGNRSTVHLPFGNRGQGAGTRLCQAGLAESDPARSGDRVRFPEPGPIGLRPSRHPGLLPPRQADRQRIH